jgi:KDO2-lipid IV(A) lauroyltransferase
LEYAVFRVLLAFLSALPERVADGVGAALGAVVGSVLRIRRGVVDRNLALVFPDRSPSWRRSVARASYRHLGREAVALFRMASWSEEEMRDRTTIEGVDAIDDAVAEGKGVVLLTGHLGNWEVAGAGLAARGIPLDVVGKGMANRRFEADLFAARDRIGMRVIEMSEAPRKVLRALAQGRAVAMVADQNMHRHGIFLPFFGRSAATARGPALFALRTGAPIIFGTSLRIPGRRPHYAVRVRRLEYTTTGDLEADIQALLLAYHQRLEEAIRSAPEQYFWQHNRWKTRPPEEQASGR